MIFSNWWFWVIVISVIGIIVWVILFFATDTNRVTTYIILGISIILLIIGIIFAVRSARKPKEKKSFAERFVPGASEAKFIAEKSGIAEKQRQFQENQRLAKEALKQKLSSVGTNLKGLYQNERFRNIVKEEIRKGALTGVTQGPLGYLSTPLYPLGLAYNIAGSEERVQKQREKRLRQAQMNYQMQQQEEALRQAQSPLLQMTNQAVY